MFTESEASSTKTAHCPPKYGLILVLYRKVHVECVKIQASLRAVAARSKILYLSDMLFTIGVGGGVKVKENSLLDPNDIFSRLRYHIHLSIQHALH